MGAFRIGIFCIKLAAVMAYRPFSDFRTYRSFHKLSFLRHQPGSVTLVKSNAKALLTTCGYQKMLLRSPRGYSHLRMTKGVALLSADNTQQEQPFEKGSLHPA